MKVMVGHFMKILFQNVFVRCDLLDSDFHLSKVVTYVNHYKFIHCLCSILTLGVQ